MKFTISGRIPSKKNSKRIVTAGNRPRIISSKDYGVWHTVASYELKGQVNRSVEGVASPGPKQIEITIFPPNKVRADLSNKAESFMDLLVYNGVIQDDNWFEVPQLSLNFGGVDRVKPRAEIVTAEAIIQSEPAGQAGSE